MKKNKAMRAAGGLFIATMLTTSVISGTYAKYVTENSGSDSARVAVFGVEIKASGDLFGQTYFDVENGNTPGGPSDGVGGADMEPATLTVYSLNQYKNGENPDNIVAPGTQNDEGLVFSITGTPEVDVKVEFNITNSMDTTGDGRATDIFLGTGRFPNVTNSGIWDTSYTVGSYTKNVDDFYVGEVYYPIQWTLWESANGTNFTKITDCTDVTIGDIEDYLESTLTTAATSAIYKAGTNLANVIGGGTTSTYKLTWKWAYGDESGISENDKKDTLLGDLAADYATANGGSISASGNADVNGMVQNAYAKINAAAEDTPLNALNRKNYSEATAMTDSADIGASMYSINTDIALSIRVVQVD